jgi:2-polyprenyl-6-methoxyphenol hydroxylase-like FAD-dependent oxidoreductase
MQQAVIETAERAGADVRRGGRATGVTPGSAPSVTVQRDGGPAETLSARVVVGADGRNSPIRKWGGFSERRDPDRLFISGAIFDGCSAPEDTVRLVSDFERGHAAIIFPQGQSRARTYVITRAAEGNRYQGDKDVARYVDDAVTTGMPREFFERASAAGPLATFDGADCWVDHPYKDGVALVGDAAASSDPSWGQGLSLTLRDVRVLRDALLANDDWDAAGHAYAAEHDRYFNVTHTVEDWFTQIFFELGPEADARRGRVFGGIAEDPSRQPDALFTGPDHPIDEPVRRRFFGED